MSYRNPVCRGAWALGTACGRCERCIATKPTTNPETAGVEPVALKECPFCGGAALRKPDPGRLNEMFGLVVDHKPGCFLGFRGIETDDAIDEAWNTRTHPAPASNTTSVGEVWRHKKRGTNYEKIGVAELQCATGQNPGEGEGLVIYRGEDGKLWARLADEFHDGRFERVPLAAIRGGSE